MVDYKYNFKFKKIKQDLIAGWTFQMSEVKGAKLCVLTM
jgi:hypothetical protein